MFEPNVEAVWAAELPDPHVGQGVEALLATSHEYRAEALEVAGISE